MIQLTAPFRGVMRLRSVLGVLAALCVAFPAHAVAKLCACDASPRAACCCGDDHPEQCSRDGAGQPDGNALKATEPCGSADQAAPALRDAENLSVALAGVPLQSPPLPTSRFQNDVPIAPSPPTASPPLFLTACSLRC